MAENTKGGSITVLLTSCLTSLDQSVLQIKTKTVRCHTADSKPVKQEVKGTGILPPLVFPGLGLHKSFHSSIELILKTVIKSNVFLILASVCHGLSLYL